MLHAKHPNSCVFTVSTVALFGVWLLLLLLLLVMVVLRCLTRVACVRVPLYVCRPVCVLDMVRRVFQSMIEGGGKNAKRIASERLNEFSPPLLNIIQAK